MLSVLLFCTLWMCLGYSLVMFLRALSISYKVRIGMTPERAEETEDLECDTDTKIMFSVLWPLTLFAIIIALGNMIFN